MRLQTPVKHCSQRLQRGWCYLQTGPDYAGLPPVSGMIKHQRKTFCSQRGSHAFQLGKTRRGDVTEKSQCQMDIRRRDQAAAADGLQCCRMLCQRSARGGLRP